MLKHFSDEQILQIVEENGACKENLLAILLKLQDLSPENYIDERTANLVADRVGLSHVQMYDILTFYAMLSIKPRGRGGIVAGIKAKGDHTRLLAKEPRIPLMKERAFSSSNFLASSMA